MNVFRNKSLRQLIANFRNEYMSHGIDEHTMLGNPIEQFEAWFHEAVKSKVPEPNAFHLATVSAEGKPSGRVLLLKGFEDSGFVFFTNYESRKGQELAQNAQASMTFLWIELIRQVRIEGTVRKISQAESEAYFQSRPRTSQIGSWVSAQSRPLRNRKELENQFTEATVLFKNKPIEKPPHWGGYCLEPTLLEFWQGRANRLHDRVQYTLLKNGVWQKQRLYP